MSLDDLPLTTQKDAQLLHDKQLQTWEITRKTFAEWLLERGKEPKSITGYSKHTTKDTLYRTDQFARYVWKDTGFKEQFTHEEADDYIESLLLDDSCGSRHTEGTEKALKRLFKYQHANNVHDSEWEPHWNISNPDRKRSINDVFSEHEIKKLYQASLEYNRIPAYSDLSPAARDKWKGYVAMSLGKPKEEVVPGDWGEVDNWKVPSLVKVSIDAGFRPVEVERSSIKWLDLEENRLLIPAEDSSKNENMWDVGLGDMAVRALENWMEQRETMEKYDDTDAIWLTREGNPYSSSSLRHLVLRLCEDAGINTQHRSVSWYSIRHATGTYYGKEGTISDAQEQLRHLSPETTKKYMHSSTKERTDLANQR